MKGNGEECDESKRGMSAQRVAEMLLATLCRSNVQLLLCLRTRPHTAISTQAPGYGPLQWADCQLLWITISQQVIRAIRRRGAFHTEYSCCFTGCYKPENSQAMNFKHQPEESLPLHMYYSSVNCLDLFTFRFVSQVYVLKKTRGDGSV